MKKFFKRFLLAVLCIVIIIGLCVGGFFLFYKPSLTVDMSKKTGNVTTGASGYLYGLAEEGVPSKNMTESIDISSVSQKVAGGLQHPIGDISHVYKQLDNTDYNVVYLQDAYSTWYYDHDSIEKQRSEGTYDWKEYLEKDFLPKVEKSVTYLSDVPYSDKVVYCLYNECDNGIWFGETMESEDAKYGVYGAYTEQGEQNFFEAWKLTYDYVKAINPNALIGGPGFYEYESGKIERFLTYCAKNNCVPEIMIYHELNDYSVLFWQHHVAEYRQLEEKLGIEALPIIVTEYGRMCDNGLPGKMLQYITQIETTKVYADNAYWRLADNLCDVAADDNSPNANWWLYRWYADMEGQTLASEYQDLFKSNFENAFIKRKAPYSSIGFMGIASINDKEDQIDIICGGRDGDAVVKLKNLDATAMVDSDSKWCITVEEVMYKGLSGIVSAPVVQSTTFKDAKSSLKIDLKDMDESSVYHITVTKISENADIDEEDYTNERYFERYEFENGKLLGDAYTYDSAYATTGEEQGMVGGMEKKGDGVSMTFSVPCDGTYDLDIIYGNANDGEANENGRQNPDDRVDATSVMTLDGKDVSVNFPNTIKSEYTDCLKKTYELKKGEHTISFKHSKGTIVLDSLLVSTADESDKIAVLDDADRTNQNNQSYLVVAPYDGYYSASANANHPVRASVDGVGFSLALTSGADSKTVSSTVYFKRGLNYIDIRSSDRKDLVVQKLSETPETIELDVQKDAVLSDGAVVETNKNNFEISYINGISCNAGKADFKVTVDEAGTYALTILYANNDEGGVHDYNVDLIERYVTVTAGGKSQDVYCRNTYSWDTYKTVTCYVDLKKGSNTISLTNSGNTKFDNQDTYAPHIAHMSVNKITH